MYLWHILTRKRDELIFKTYNAMKLKPVVNDWHSLIQQEKGTYDIQLTDEQKSLLSKKSFNKLFMKQLINLHFIFCWNVELNTLNKRKL